MEFDLIALGETMLALAPPAGSALRNSPTLLVDHAGAESNTCVGLARLGLRTAWVSRLGTDAAGDRILSAIRDEVRRQRSLLLLDNRALSVGEIAAQLGYTELPSFTRAFRKWTGMTPQAYRTQRER